LRDGLVVGEGLEPGMPSVRTNALLAKVRGKSQINPACCTASTLRAMSPMVAAIQNKAVALLQPFGQYNGTAVRHEMSFHGWRCSLIKQEESASTHRDLAVYKELTGTAPRKERCTRKPI